MVEKPFLAKSKGIEFSNFGHEQGIQVHTVIKETVSTPCSLVCGLPT